MTETTSSFPAFAAELFEIKRWD